MQPPAYVCGYCQKFCRQYDVVVLKEKTFSHPLIFPIIISSTLAVAVENVLLIVRKTPRRIGQRRSLG
jgi:hypothetical protein